MRTSPSTRVERAKALLEGSNSYPESAALDALGRVTMTVADFQTLCEMLAAYQSIDPF